MKRVDHQFINGVETKRCSRCKEWIPISDFYKASVTWDGLNTICKPCNKSVTTKWNEENRERRLAKAIEWNRNHPENNKKATKKYAEKNRDKRAEAARIKRWSNINLFREQERIRQARRVSTIRGKINARISSGIRYAIRDQKGGRKWESLVGYTLNDLQNRLKHTMPDGYTWDDFMAGQLHIDHIIPQAAFNYVTPDDIDFKRCWALSNLRLLPAIENIKKGDKVDKPFQPSLAIAA